MSSKIPPEVWGPHVWYTYHVIASGFPDNPTPEDKKNYSELYKFLARTLPCPVCTKDMVQIVNSKPPDVSSRDALFLWTYEVHNLVAAKIGKNTLPPLPIVKKWYGIAPDALQAMVPAPPQPKQQVQARPAVRPNLNPPRSVINSAAFAKAAPLTPAPQAIPSQPRYSTYRSVGITGGVGGRNPEVAAKATMGVPGPSAVYRGNTQFVPKKKGCGCGGSRR